MIKTAYLWVLMVSMWHGFSPAQALGQEKGVIIILNGPSASGKTSIQKKIQEHFNEPYLRLGIDGFFDAILPDYYGLGEVEPKGAWLSKDMRYVETIEVGGKKAINLVVGPIGRKVISGMHHAIKAYAQQGNNLVVDYILYDKEWFGELVTTLHGFKVYYIGIKYPLAVIEEREAKRSTSPVGHARSHYETAHHYGNYDLTIDDASLSAEGIALKIKDFVQKNPAPKAFDTYFQKF